MYSKQRTTVPAGPRVGMVATVYEGRRCEMKRVWPLGDYFIYILFPLADRATFGHPSHRGRTQS